MKTKTILLFKKNEKFICNTENWLSLAIVLIMLLFILKCISVALTNVYSFDGGMNVQVAQNLAKGFGYKTNYGGILFDPRIQTGLPVTLLVAILFWIFGESFAAGLMVNAIYLVLAAFAILYYLKKCLKVNSALVLLAVLLLYGTPNIFTNGFGLYGEIPSFFYLMVALIFLHKQEQTSKAKFFFWAGVFLGVGYLTKTVILICVPALFFASIFDIVVKRRLTLRQTAGVKGLLREYFKLLAGFFIPAFGFELYKMISLGIGVYLQWWKDQLANILNQAGVTQDTTSTNGPVAKFLGHMNLLSSYTGITNGIIIFLLALVLLLFFAILTYGIFHFWTKQKPGESEKALFSNDVLVLVSVTLSYYGWWLLILHTEQAWDRRIAIGYCLLEVCLVLVIFLLEKYRDRLAPRKKQVAHILYRIITAGYIGLLLAGTVFNLIHSGNYLISLTDTAEKTAFMKAGQFIRDLPDSAEIFGFGWWQAPVVAFASGRTFNNILANSQMTNPSPLNEKYFVVDHSSYEFDPSGYQNILDQYNNKLVFLNKQEEIYVYKLDSRPVFAYKGFSDLEKSQVSYSSIDFRKDDSDVFVRNVYIGENNNSGKWAQEVTGYLFRYKGENKLKIILWFQTLDLYGRRPIELQIYADRVPIYSYKVHQDGQQEIIVPLENINGDTLEITIISDSFFVPEGDYRQMAFFLGAMELVK